MRSKEVRRLYSSLYGVIALLGPPVAASFLPDTLRAAADLFFNADYAQADAALTDELALQTGANAKPHFYAIRAAARLALYDSSQPKDQSLRDRAADDVRECKKLDSGFKLNELAFSPRFRAFFDEIK